MAFLLSGLPQHHTIQLLAATELTSPFGKFLRFFQFLEGKVKCLLFFSLKLTSKKAGEHEIGKEHAIFDESIGHIILKYNMQRRAVERNETSGDRRGHQEKVPGS